MCVSLILVGKRATALIFSNQKPNSKCPGNTFLLSDSCSAACAAVNDAARFFQILQAPQQKNWWLAVAGELTGPYTQCCQWIE